MDDTTLIRYENLGTVDSQVTCVASANKTLFLGNSYGDIILVRRQKQEVLHNHSGEITSLVGRRCGRKGMEDGVYLLTGTSIGNVYLHLTFPDNITRSRILYKFVAMYSVLAICPHPEFEVFNLKRVSSRLTIDFTEEISRDSDSWDQLQTSSISVESFVVSLGNGAIYLVNNSRCQKNNENDGKKNGESENYTIMYITAYSPHVNVKMNWNINYFSVIDGEGFYLFKLPNFESILFIPKEYFSNQKVKKEEVLQGKEERKNHYLYNIIDNNELYESTEESEININAKSFEEIKEVKNSKDNHSEVREMKKFERKVINNRSIKKEKNWGTMSRLVSDCILVGWNNTILYIKLMEENDEDFRGHEHLFLNTFPNKEVINKVKKGRRSKRVVRGYIDYKLVMPKNFKILNIVNNDNNQFNLVMWEMEEEPCNRQNEECYTCEKYNSDGTVYNYKLRPPKEKEIKKQKEKGKIKIVNMVFNVDQKNDNIRSLGIICSDSVKIGEEKDKNEKELIITESTIRNENQDDVYMWVNKVIMHINYCKNYIRLLKYYITNSYSKKVVVDHFKNNLEYLIRDKKEVNEEIQNKNKYAAEYIKTFIEYMMEIEYYKGIKVVAKILKEQGKLEEYINKVFTEELRNKLEEKGYLQDLIQEILTISEKGSNLTLMEMITWKLKPELEEMIVHKGKNVVVNHIVQLNKINNCNNNNSNNYNNNNRNNYDYKMVKFMNNLKSFNKKEEIKGEDLYSVLYKFLQIKDYKGEFEETFERNHLKNKVNCLIFDQKQEMVTDDFEKSKENEEIRKLEICRVESEILDNRLKALKYYHKYLNDQFGLINTKGVIYSREISKEIKKEDERYIEKNLVDCNICDTCRARSEEVKNKLNNKVGGRLLSQPKVNSVLYFRCKHTVHEKCQIRLINQLRSSKNVVFVVPGKHPIYESSELINTCLICLVTQ